MRTLTVCTEPFEKMAELEKRSLGMPDLGIAVVPHPLVYRTAEEIERIADALVPLLERHFGPGSGS